jgi:hypothetical protein
MEMDCHFPAVPSSELDSLKRGPPSLDAAAVCGADLSRSTSHAPMKGRDRDDGATLERRRVVYGGWGRGGSVGAGQ